MLPFIFSNHTIPTFIKTVRSCCHQGHLRGYDSWNMKVTGLISVTSWLQQKNLQISFYLIPFFPFRCFKITANVQSCPWYSKCGPSSAALASPWGQQSTAPQTCRLRPHAGQDPRNSYARARWSLDMPLNAVTWTLCFFKSPHDLLVFCKTTTCALALLPHGHKTKCTFSLRFWKS